MRKIHAVGGLTVFLTIAGIIFLLLWLPPHQAELTSFALKYPLFAPVIIITWWIISIIIPPLPGAILSFAFIPIIGWFWAYIYSVIGILIGASIAFGIARKFREPVVARFIPIQQLHKWEGKLSHKTEFLAFLGIRLTTGPIMDFISYVAGLSKISYKKFFLATFISEIPFVIWFYFGDIAYKNFAAETGVAAIIIILIIAVVVLYFTKKQKNLENS